MGSALGSYSALAFSACPWDSGCRGLPCTDRGSRPLWRPITCGSGAVGTGPPRPSGMVRRTKPGTYEATVAPTCTAGVHGSRARGRPPRPGMTAIRATLILRYRTSPAGLLRTGISRHPPQHRRFRRSAGPKPRCGVTAHRRVSPTVPHPSTRLEPVAGSAKAGAAFPLAPRVEHDGCVCGFRVLGAATPRNVGGVLARGSSPGGPANPAR